MIKLNGIEFSRKPATWQDVYTSVPASRLPADLKTYDAVALGIARATLATFNHPVDEQHFLVTAGGARYLVDTQGYDYARYVTKVDENN